MRSGVVECAVPSTDIACGAASATRASPLRWCKDRSATPTHTPTASTRPADLPYFIASPDGRLSPPGIIARAWRVPAAPRPRLFLEHLRHAARAAVRVGDLH